MSQLTARYDSLKEATQLALKESQTLEGMMDEVLTKVVHETIKKYQQKVAAGVEDSVSDLLDNFKRKVSDAIFDAASTWKIENRETVLFPKGCRYAYTRGTSTIFVIEQDPGIRSLSFYEGMVEHEYQGCDRTMRLSLSMPYVVFLVHFKSKRLSGLYCGWRTAPLRTMNDLISRPVLPNIHEGLAVCMDHVGQGETFAEATENVITNFWNSSFNNDVSEHWWQKHEFHEHMYSGDSWEVASVDDPLWILGIDFPNQRTLDNMIELLTMHETEPDENAFRHDLAESIDTSVRTLFLKMSKYFKKTKFEKYHPKDVTEPLRDAIISAVGEFSDVVFSLDKEISGLSDSLKQQKNPTVRVGNFWTEYAP